MADAMADAIVDAMADAMAGIIGMPWPCDSDGSMAIVCLLD